MAHPEIDVIRVISAWKANRRQRTQYAKPVAEKYRDIDVSGAKRGAVVKPTLGKTKIPIRLDNAVIEYFRNAVDEAGGGNYQSLINDALLEHIRRQATADLVRQVVREELVSYGERRKQSPARRRKAATRR